MPVVLIHIEQAGSARHDVVGHQGRAGDRDRLGARHRLGCFLGSIASPVDLGLFRVPNPGTVGIARHLQPPLVEAPVRGDGEKDQLSWM
jgi:hypothetical protein